LIAHAPLARSPGLGAAFTPTRPKAGHRQLVGRKREQSRIVQALLDDRAHVVLYSERGRGKTTLANWVMETLRQSGVLVGRYTCDATTTYDGSREIGLSIPNAIIDRVVGIARGMPHMAQLLGLRLTQETFARSARVATDEDYRSAITRLIEEASPRTQALYGALTRGRCDGMPVQDLLRVARAPQDEWGRIVIRETADGGAVIAGNPINESGWAAIKATKALLPATQSADLWTFADRALFYHALLLAELEDDRPDAVSTHDTTHVSGAIKRIPALQRG
jgi:Cdc6-like AAA superfamily ATPase